MATASLIDSGYSVRVGDITRDRELVLEIWRECGGDFSPDFSDGAARYRWFYEQNPAGPGTVFILEHRGTARPVGVLGIGPRDFAWRDQTIRGAMLVDFVVHPRHRVLFPALLTQRTARVWGHDRLDVLVGHPNVGARTIMRRVGGYAEIEQPRLARIVDYAAHLRRYLPSGLASALGACFTVADSIETAWSSGRRSRAGPLRFVWAKDVDTRYDRLWQTQHREDRCLGVRDAAFLHWRFAEQPGRAYRILECLAARSDELRGYFVCQADGDTLVVSDLALGAEEAEQQCALDGLIAAAKLCEVRAISIDLLPDPSLRLALARAGFRDRETHAAMVSLTAQWQARMGPISWFLTAADANV
jgi:hypothetical protein